MKIPLSDPIWTRLYGPYGLQDVASILEQLVENWDEDLAENLYWEKLHHQDDLYPVTFAALPWLWEFAPRPPKGSVNALLFFSHVLNCAMRQGGTGCDGKGPRGRYRGLSLQVPHHRLRWIPEDKHLRDADMDVLQGLQNWFSGTAPEIAERCIRAVSEEDRYIAAMLATGFAALIGGFNTAAAMIMWADDEDMGFILEHCSPTAQDRVAAKAIRSAIETRHGELAAFLKRFAEAASGDHR